MKKMIVIVLVAIWLLSANYAFAVEPEIQVEVSENLKITAIMPTLEMEKEGEKKGRLVVEFTIQNMGSTPAQFIIFASAKEEGGWASGRVILPKEGKLSPQETVKGKIKTPYKGAELPPIIKIEGSEKVF
ncbi:MAG: hypothetical protein AB1488_07050 [Nitrospirota bacterium]